MTSPTLCPPNGYADDLALLFSHKSWNEVEDVLSFDMQRIAEYLSAWRLRLSTGKTTCTAFHLNNRESSRKLAVTVNGTTIPCTENPTYVGVRLDRQLTFKQHLEGLCGKSEPVIAAYVSWLAQDGVPTPLLHELQRWAWSTVLGNTPPQLDAAAPTLRS